MAEKFKIIPLGGLNEIGKNMTVYEYGGDIIVVDCGMAFPGDDMYGIDCVIPDVSYLVKNRSRLRGLFITHGHEDHIGAIPYVLKQINMPIYCTRFTAGLIKLKLQEHGLASSTKLITVEPGQTVRAGKFQVEFIHVNHSIADSVAFAIHTRMGAVVHTGDFKIDSTPIDGEVIDLARFGELGKQGVLALLADSTNVERPGYTMSERAVGATFKRQFTGCDKRIIVTTFASNVHRIQQVLDAAAACGRKVAVTGRSMENIMKVSTELGYMKVPKNTLMDINRIKGLPLNQQVIVTTGSQGEEMSALYRMAFSTHKQVDIGPGDKVIISASAIPGNEVTVGRVINELFRKGADVVYDKADMLHVSGHACQEELKIIHALTKPRFFIPLHGEQRMLQIHKRVAESMGMAPTSIVVADNGSVIELTTKHIKTPICEMDAPTLAGKKFVVVPILRAGLGLVDGVLRMVPSARVGHIGMYRDEETLEPHPYFCKMPKDVAERDVMIVDPMLATGGSACEAIGEMVKRGCKHITLMVLVAAPEGIKAVQEKYPDVNIYAGALDDHLNEHGYIVPGLGDAGDRIFGTK